MKVLLELRPALDGFSGIPQETRLLFRGLAGFAGVEVEGLLQSGNLRIEAGLPLPPARAPGAARGIDEVERLSRVVVSLQQHRPMRRPARWLSRLRLYAAAARWGADALADRTVPTTAFPPQGFEDFVWQSMFAKSLPGEDFDAVTGKTLRLLATPWSVAHGMGVLGARLGRPLYPRIDTRGCEVFIAETPFPGRVTDGTRLVVRYHDSMPIWLPHTVINTAHHRAAHTGALRRNAADGAWFACVSETTRRELVGAMPELEARSATLPNMVPGHFQVAQDVPAARIEEILVQRAAGRDAPGKLAQGPFVLMVGTLEPRKNHRLLFAAVEALRGAGRSDLRMVLVGSPGWGPGRDEIERTLARPWVHHLAGVPAQELALLYRHAAATVCPSVAEGFDFPGVEAQMAGGLVVASDIPVHREILGDEVLYFPTYEQQALEQRLVQALNEGDSPGLQALRQRGVLAAGRYLPEAVLPQWQAFLERLAA